MDAVVVLVLELFAREELDVENIRGLACSIFGRMTRTIRGMAHLVRLRTIMATIAVL
jgi:hypothetical protein